MTGVFAATNVRLLRLRLLAHRINKTPVVFYGGPNSGHFAENPIHAFVSISSGVSSLLRQQRLTHPHGR